MDKGYCRVCEYCNCVVCIRVSACELRTIICENKVWMYLSHGLCMDWTQQSLNASMCFSLMSSCLIVRINKEQL